MSGGKLSKESEFYHAKRLVLDFGCPIIVACKTAKLSRSTYRRWNNKLLEQATIWNRIKKLLRF